MPVINTLENIEIRELAEVFNLSFADYLVPFKITEEQLRTKIATENIRLDYSVGAFENQKLVGFILHFYDEQNNIKQVYNGGTGVLKEFRGNNLTQKMYSFILPKLKNDRINYLILEVLSENIKAIKAYKNVGFGEARELLCFKGDAALKGSINTEASVEKLTAYNWPILTTFWDFIPTWQNSIPVVEKLKNNISYAAFINNKLVAYIIFNPETNRIQHLATSKSYRKQGIAKKLIATVINDFGNQLSLVNVDKKSLETKLFLESIGLKNYVNQLEMKYEF